MIANNVNNRNNNNNNNNNQNNNNQINRIESNVSAMQMAMNKRSVRDPAIDRLAKSIKEIAVSFLWRH